MISMIVVFYKSCGTLLSKVLKNRFRISSTPGNSLNTEFIIVITFLGRLVVRETCFDSFDLVFHCCEQLVAYLRLLVRGDVPIVFLTQLLEVYRRGLELRQTQFRESRLTLASVIAQGYSVVQRRIRVTAWRVYVGRAS